MEEYDAPGLLVATTNIESSLDNALFRRFDEVFLVPLPGPEEIEKLLRMTLSAVQTENSIRWPHLVDQLSGAPAAMVVKAAQDAAKTAVLAGTKLSPNHTFETLLPNSISETLPPTRITNAGTAQFRASAFAIALSGQGTSSGGGKTSPQTVANRNARQAHSTSLTRLCSITQHQLATA